MRCKYRFKVNGRLKVETSFPLPTGAFLYELERDEFGVVTYVSVTVEVSDQSMWPSAFPNPAPGLALHVNITRPYFDLIAKNLRAAESILSLFGLESIDVPGAEIEWLPADGVEKGKLGIYNFKSEIKPTPRDEWPAISFDLVARGFLAAERSWHIETALSFFRKGRIDMRDERYIEAIYDFYFMLESLFAEGRFKSAQVEQIFLSSPELLKHLAAVAQDPELLLIVSRDPIIKKSFQEHYWQRPPADIVSRIVKLRGFLHHHSGARKDAWHPEDHKRFGADALFLQQLCYAAGFSLASGSLYAEDVIAAYLKIVAKAPGMSY